MKLLHRALLFLLVAVTMNIMYPVDGNSKENYSIDIRSKKELGRYLVDSQGMTLYYFQMDSKGQSACVGDCAKQWPVFYVEKLLPNQNLKEYDFGMITREDGKKQTTYKSKPLYHHSRDQKSGDTKGHGKYGIWFAATP